MNKQQNVPGPSETENQLELQGFLNHMHEKHANIERDLLLQEVARKLKLTDDLRFSYFFDHCKQYKARPSFEDVTHYTFDEYKERLQDLVNDIANDPCRSKDIELLTNILRVVHIVMLDCLIEDLDKTLQTAYPDYYSQVRVTF